MISSRLPIKLCACALLASKSSTTNGTLRIVRLPILMESATTTSPSPRAVPSTCTPWATGRSPHFLASCVLMTL